LFQIKLTNRSLPTLANMNNKYPHLYPSAKCTLCNEANETLEHLMSCPFFKDTWKAIIENVIAIKLRNKVFNKWDIAVTTHHLDKLQRALTDNDLVSGRDRKIDFITGLVAQSVSDIVRQIVMSNNKVNKVLTYIMISITKEFRSKIWQTRCNIHAEKKLTYKDRQDAFARSSTTSNSNITRVTNRVIKPRTPIIDDILCYDDIPGASSVANDEEDGIIIKRSPENNEIILSRADKQEWAVTKTIKLIQHKIEGIVQLPAWSFKNQSVKYIAWNKVRKQQKAVITNREKVDQRTHMETPVQQGTSAQFEERTQKGFKEYNNFFEGLACKK
jgi:hypothetical protein